MPFVIALEWSAHSIGEYEKDYYGEGEKYTENVQPL
jgi:hypothetical protein